MGLAKLNATTNINIKKVLFMYILKYKKFKLVTMLILRWDSGLKSLIFSNSSILTQNVVVNYISVRLPLTGGDTEGVLNNNFLVHKLELGVEIAACKSKPSGCG